MPIVKFKANRAGIVLTEALIAVATLATATIILGSMITSGIDTTKTSRDYLIAQNLLTEGVEMIKIIRNSNRMIKPDKPACWLTADPSMLLNTTNPTCDNSNSVNTGTNYLIVDSKNSLKFEKGAANDLNLENNQEGNEKYRLQQYDTNLNKPGKFYRSIKLINKDEDTADFEVKLQWKDGTKTKTILQKATISNYI